MLLSLFSGAGGLDLGFEQAGFEIGMAFDLRRDSIASYNRNRSNKKVGHVADVRSLTLSKLDSLYGEEFKPIGVIGGPPCQSFSKANVQSTDDDPRHQLPEVYGNIIISLNERSPITFFAFENVTGLRSEKHIHHFEALKSQLSPVFSLEEAVLNATNYCTPQKRERLFLVGINKTIAPGITWSTPPKTTPPDTKLTVRGAIFGLPEPTYYRRGLSEAEIAHHANHWCMVPKSAKFTTPGALRAGDGANRSFKTLSWEEPSITVAYGHREVHIHPDCHRRLSVYEAMLLQGFPPNYVLTGSLSSQITQVSEAVPPPMAEAVARSIKAALESTHQPRGSFVCAA